VDCVDYIFRRQRFQPPPLRVALLLFFLALLSTADFLGTNGTTGPFLAGDDGSSRNWEIFSYEQEALERTPRSCNTRLYSTAIVRLSRAFHSALRRITPICAEVQSGSERTAADPEVIHLSEKSPYRRISPSSVATGNRCAFFGNLTPRGQLPDGRWRPGGNLDTCRGFISIYWYSRKKGPFLVKLTILYSYESKA
jgi:hypothetical protein